MRRDGGSEVAPGVARAGARRLPVEALIEGWGLGWHLGRVVEHVAASAADANPNALGELRAACVLLRGLDQRRELPALHVGGAARSRAAANAWVLEREHGLSERIGRVLFHLLSRDVRKTDIAAALAAVEAEIGAREDRILAAARAEWADIGEGD